MDDDLAYQVCEHAYATAKWVLTYIKRHNLRFELVDRSDILEFHLKRLDAIFSELEQPLRMNPLLSDDFIHPKPSDEDSTAPWPKFYIRLFLPRVTDVMTNV